MCGVFSTLSLSLCLPIDYDDWSVTPVSSVISVQSVSQITAVFMALKSPHLTAATRQTKDYIFQLQPQQKEVTVKLKFGDFRSMDFFVQLVCIVLCL